MEIYTRFTSFRKVVLGFLLLAGLALAGGYLVTSKQSPSEPAVANASPESTASLAGPTSTAVTAADPVPTATQPPVVSPSATPFDSAQDKLRTGTAEPRVVSTAELTIEIVTATPCDTCPDKGQPAATDTPMPSLPIAPVPGAQAPDFTLTDLNGDEVTLGELRGQVVLLNFWATW
jgi:hypothetical protein